MSHPPVHPTKGEVEAKDFGLAAVEASIDTLIGAVNARLIRPDRSWAVAMDALIRRRDLLRGSSASPRPHTPGDQ